MQTSGKKKESAQRITFSLPSAALSYEKIVQTSGKKKESAQRITFSFPSAALSYEKIVQTSGKKKESAQRFSVSFPSAAVSDEKSPACLLQHGTPLPGKAGKQAAKIHNKPG